MDHRFAPLCLHVIKKRLSAYDHILNKSKIYASNTTVHCSLPPIRFESIMIDYINAVVQSYYLYRIILGITLVFSGYGGGLMSWGRQVFNLK